jgi:heat shock protein HtpX
VLDQRAQRRYRLRNEVQTVLLFGGMAAVLGGLAWLLLGVVGLICVLAAVALALASRPRVPAGLVLSMYGARPLPPAAAPELHRFVRVLAERAGLPTVPVLYYVPSPLANAFAVGGRDEAALAVTDGLLRRLSSRELVGVLAHEVCHVLAGDLRITNLSDTVGRLTHGLSYLGLLLLVLAVPLMATGATTPFWVALLLIVGPTLVTLLQLALSRAREYDADLEAAALTGDPEGLASALEQLERATGRLWERVMVPRGHVPDPLLLRTHPPTADRARRLRELVPRHERRQLGDDRQVPISAFRPVATPARLRFPGIRW